PAATTNAALNATPPAKPPAKPPAALNTTPPAAPIATPPAAPTVTPYVMPPATPIATPDQDSPQLKPNPYASQMKPSRRLLTTASTMFQESIFIKKRSSSLDSSFGPSRLQLSTSRLNCVGQKRIR